jgi:hypothetical protein
VLVRVIQHLKLFVCYYATSRTVEIASRYDAAQSLSRILKLDGSGEVRIRKTKDDRLIAVGAQWGARSNVLPVFEGQLEEQGGRVFLKGRVGIDSGIRTVLGFFCFVIFIFFPLRLGTLLGGTQYSAPGAGYIAPLVFLGLLTFGYLIGKDDSAKIVSNLKRVLNDDNRT